MVGRLLLLVICTVAMIHSFIHSGHFYSAPSSPLLLRVSRRSAQATVGPYVAARAGVEPTTLRLKVISTNAPPRPTMMAR